MAEPKDSDNKPASGPVKPPVLDLKANEAGKAEAKRADQKPADKPGAKPDPKPAAAARPADNTVRPPADGARSGFGWGAALAGGVFGLGAAYALAYAGLWPSAPVPAAPADPRLAQFAAAIPELETVTATTQSELATLNQRVGALETAEPAVATAGEPVDLSGIEAELAALTQRVDGVAAAPRGDPEALTALREEVAGLAGRLDELGARVETAETGLETLDTSVADAAQQLADQPDALGTALQLPLVLSGLEAAFASGRPFAAELAALRTALPGRTVPEPIAAAAEAGLPRPDAIGRSFSAVLPAMLAGRPAAADAQWQDGALDWFRSAIALRPAGEIDGDTPEAVMSRLEAAVARRDFVAANELMAQLPEPMRAAAGTVAGDIALHAEATAFIENLRTEALAGATP